MVHNNPQPRNSRYMPYSKEVLSGDQPRIAPAISDRLERYKLNRAEELQSLFTPSAHSFNPVSTTTIRANRAATGYYDRQDAAAWRTVGLQYLGYLSVTDTTPTPDAVIQFVWNSREPVEDQSTSGPAHRIRVLETVSERIPALPNSKPTPDPASLFHNSLTIESKHDVFSTLNSLSTMPSYDLPSIIDDPPDSKPYHDLSASTQEISPLMPTHDSPSIMQDSPPVGPTHTMPRLRHVSSPLSSSHDLQHMDQGSQTLAPMGGSTASEVEHDSPPIKPGRRVSSRQVVQRRSLSPTGLPSHYVLSILKKAYREVVRPQRRHIVKCKATQLDQTYGEVMPALIEKFLKMKKLSWKSSFLDLGSGIGNVVLQVAMRTGCRSSGIECVKARAKVAQEQLEAVKRLLGKKVGAMGVVHLIEGDMLKNPIVDELITEADLVLINNLKFQSPLNDHISKKLLKLKAGAHVISIEQVGASPRGSKASARDKDSLGSKVSISRRAYAEDDVSWKAGGGTYLLHVMQGNK